VQAPAGRDLNLDVFVEREPEERWPQRSGEHQREPPVSMRGQEALGPTRIARKIRELLRAELDPRSPVAV
jgi:hypothetical protein